MYQQFFGLKQLPFKVSPDPQFFFKHASRENVLSTLLYSIARDDAILKIVGEVGVGKTTLLRLLSSRLPASYVKVYISAPNLSAADFLRLICEELSLDTTPQATKQQVLSQFKSYLMDRHREGTKVILLIDEAQSMTLDTLEEIRLLGNLETETEKLLQIVLCGQPELDVTLNDERVRPLKSRIATQVYLTELSPEEVQHYLNYRMRVAGNIQNDVFTLKVSKKIQKITKGLPRQINLIADKLLMAAYSTGDVTVKSKHFRSVGLDENREESTSKRIWVFVFLMTFVVVMIVFFWSFQKQIVSYIETTKNSWYEALFATETVASASGQNKVQKTLANQSQLVQPNDLNPMSAQNHLKEQAESIDHKDSEAQNNLRNEDHYIERTPKETINRAEQSGNEPLADDSVIDSVNENKVKKTVSGTEDQTNNSFVENQHEQLKSNESEKIRKNKATKQAVKDDYGYAFELMKNNRFSEAKIAFEKVWRQYPKSYLADNAVYWMGEISIVLNQPSEAERWFKEVVEHYPKSSKTASALLRYGDVLRTRGEFEKADVYYKRLITQFPSRRETVIAKKYFKTQTPN